MEVRKLILFSAFIASSFLLWNAWQTESLRSRSAQNQTITTQQQGDVPAAVPSKQLGVQNVAAETETAAATVSLAPVVVKTDVLEVAINLAGASIERVSLLQHKATEDPSQPFILLDNTNRDWFVAQSGLVGQQFPNHRSVFQLTKQETADDGVQTLEFVTENAAVRLVKTYTFTPGSYLVQVSQTVENRTAQPIQPDGYYQLARRQLADDVKEERGLDRTYFGPAFYTDEEKFTKLPFEDIADNAERRTPKALTPVGAREAWVALVQHYFVGAWLPRSGQGPFDLYARALGDNKFSIGVMESFGQIEPAQSATQQMALYVGPQEQKNLEAIAPGFDLVVDYGWLTVIAAPLFWLLELLYGYVHNWGVAIILLTIVIKVIFFPLSAASQKSMAKLKDVSPRIKQLQELYKDDREKLNKEMMALYQTEKINPLGGCLPILVQIPVFIALYWVLLSSVEIRHAPFIWWWQDLSAKDPYFVLPILMGITSFIQTKMNPTPPDPMQAKLMTFLPIIFTVMFLWFPAGLVLYWVVSNSFTILQQWFLSRYMNRGKTKKTTAKA